MRACFAIGLVTTGSAMAQESDPASSTEQGPADAPPEEAAAEETSTEETPAEELKKDHPHQRSQQRLRKKPISFLRMY